MLPDTISQPLLTLDVDWAPDFVIDDVAQCLLERRIRATWFVTHASPAIDRLRDHPQLFELGIHPNFLPGSSHGADPDAVLDHCLELVPEAQSMRTHCLEQSSPLLARIMGRHRIRIDVSLFLPRAQWLAPVEYRIGDLRLLRVPYLWGDAYELAQQEPCWSLAEVVGSASGMKVLNFHPMHVYLNSRSLEAYNEAKRRSGDLSTVTEGELSKLVSFGRGVRTLFLDVLTVLERERSTMRILDLETPPRFSPEAQP